MRAFVAGLFHELVRALAALFLTPKETEELPEIRREAPSPASAAWTERSDGSRLPVWGADLSAQTQQPEAPFADLPSPQPWEPEPAAAAPVATDDALPDWRAALLEDTGVRPAGGDQAGASGGRRAEGPVAGGTQYEGSSPQDWMIDGAYAGGYGNASLRGPAGDVRDPILYAGPQGLPPFDDGPRRRWIPTRHPAAQRDELMRQVHRLYDAPTQHLLERITDEPLFPYARRQWRQAADARLNNQQIVDAVFLRLSRLMGGIYAFEPAALAYTPQMPASYFEWYDWEQNKLYILEQVLAGSYADLMEALAHGQAHAMQRQLIVAAGAGRLDGELAAFGDLMVREYQAQPGPGCIGWVKGYHAFQVSYAVGYRARSLA